MSVISSFWSQLNLMSCEMSTTSQSVVENVPIWRTVYTRRHISQQDVLSVKGTENGRARHEMTFLEMQKYIYLISVWAIQSYPSNVLDYAIMPWYFEQLSVRLPFFGKIDVQETMQIVGLTLMSKWDGNHRMLPKKGPVDEIRRTEHERRTSGSWGWWVVQVYYRTLRSTAHFKTSLGNAQLPLQDFGFGLYHLTMDKYPRVCHFSASILCLLMIQQCNIDI